MPKATETLVEPQQARSRQSLERILVAAQEVLVRDGLGGFSVGAVATAAGISIGGLYGRVPGKTELLHALKERVLSEVDERIRERLEEQTHRTYAHVVVALVRAVTEHFSQNEALHRLLFQAGDATMSASGSATRRRGSDRYRAAMLAALGGAASPTLQIAIDLSYEIIVNTTIARVRQGGGDEISWADFAKHLTVAAVAYVQTMEGREAT